MVYALLQFVIAFASLISHNGKNKLERKITCFFIFFTMLLIMGLRHIEYAGVDTIVYARDFNRIVNKNISFRGIFNEFYKDYGFYLAAKLFSLISTNVNFWIFCCAIPYLLSVTWLIYKYSKNIFISFILFVTLDFYMYDFQLMRHVTSFAFIIISIKYLIEKKFKKFLLLVLIASSFQIVSLIFLIAYPISRFKIDNRILIGLLLISAVGVYIIPNKQWISLLFKISFLKNDRFAHFQTADSLTYSYFFIELLFLILSAFYMRRYPNSQKENINGYLLDQKSLLIICGVGAFFYLFQVIIGEFYRVAQYFSIFTIILVPMAVQNERNKITRNIIYLLIVIFCLKHFWGGYFYAKEYSPYIPFWKT